MSTSRTCIRCRTAKVKCDLARPCGRCETRGFECVGIPSDIDYIFRDENQSARRNSERSRRRSQKAYRAIILRTNNDIAQTSPLNRQTDSLTIEQELETLEASQRLGNIGWSQVSQPPKRDIDARAVDKFFVDWLLYSRDQANIRGFWNDLPMMYHDAPPHSPLSLAIKAAAFAGMKDAVIEGVPFNIKARQCYGAALRRMKEVVGNQKRLVEDQALAALLMIDMFEFMYLARSEPLGPHNKALMHILLARGEGQLYDQSKITLWRTAYYRLQSRQILNREGPGDDQVPGWVNKLNMNKPDIRIFVDVMRMNIFCADVKRVTQTSEASETELVSRTQQVRRLIEMIQQLITSIDNWTIPMRRLKEIAPRDLDQIKGPAETAFPDSLPVPRFPPSTLFKHHNTWLGSMWNFHAASQIVLRESLIEIVKFCAAMEKRELDPAESNVVQTQYNAVRKLSDAIIESLPILLECSGEVFTGPIPGKMSSKCSLIFTALVVQRAKHTSAEQKNTAQMVIDWIRGQHNLG